MIARRLFPVLIAMSVAAPIQAVASLPADVERQRWRLPAVITGTAPSLHPEGIGYDPRRGALVVSSVRHGTVSIVRRDGTVGTLVDDPVLVSTLGYVSTCADAVWWLPTVIQAWPCEAHQQP